MATDVEVLRYLEQLDFPAGKEDIVREAERQGAPRQVLRALRGLPPVDYANRTEVTRSAGTDTAEQETSAEKAMRARDRKHQRVAEHLRRP